MKDFKKIFFYALLILIFVLGLWLRIKTYLVARPLWHDECSLAASIINRDIFGFFAPLEFSQKAPPLFMMAVKTITLIFGEKELALRAIPFVSGILSLFAFYFLSRRFLCGKFSVLFANLLFAVNYRIIYFSQEFKQYSTDVLAVILSLLVLSRADFKRISCKKAFLYGVLSVLVIMFSFPSAFVIGAFALVNLKNFKRLACFVAPLGVFLSVYYFKFLEPVRSLEVQTYSDYWFRGGLKENLNYFFDPNNFVLLGIILFLWGVVLLFKRRMLVFTVLLAILASSLHLYPMKERVALYLLPIVIIFIAKTLDTKKKWLAVPLILCLIYFSKYNLTYFQNMNFAQYDPRAAMQTLKKSYKKGEIVAYNAASHSEFVYYSHYFDFKPRSVLVNLPKYDKKLYFSILKQLPLSKCRFYYVYDYSHSPVIQWLDEFLVGRNEKRV